MSILLPLLMLLTYFEIHTNITFSSSPLDDKTSQLTFSFKIPRGDFIYKDYINFSIDTPNVTLSDWEASINSISYYDPSFKETKQVFNKDVTLTINATQTNTTLINANIYLSYYQHSHKKIVQKLFPITFKQKETIAPLVPENATIMGENKIAPCISNKKNVTETSWTNHASIVIKTAQSVWAQIILVLLLGLLLSLTPCFYPTLPTTIGILRSQCKTLHAQNFLLALFYTVGIASTFALLGLTVTTIGYITGDFMSNSAFIFMFVLFLAYLGFATLGFYRLYIPSFLQTKKTVTDGSLFSAFLFGTICGTTASPCLSPALVLLLSIVATLDSKMLGLLLLFSFGIGLHIPLLLIGTSPSSLKLLPNAGAWMIEIKKIFGLMLLGMCIHLLQRIVPWHITLWVVTMFSIGTGFFYLHIGKHSNSLRWAHVSKSIGSVLIASAIFLCFKSYQATDIHHTTLTTPIKTPPPLISAF